jgi:hypothetical protein
MKTIELTISERLFALAILNGFKGNLETLALILEDIKQLPIAEEEWAKAELVKEKNEDGTEKQWRWSDEKGGVKSVNLQKETAKFLQETMKSKSEKGEFALSDKAAITLFKKLD